jgi:hypothetical protein
MISVWSGRRVRREHEISYEDDQARRGTYRARMKDDIVGDVLDTTGIREPVDQEECPLARRLGYHLVLFICR